jgi:hypothetical protein
MIKSKNNFLDYVPLKNGENEWSKATDGLVTVHAVHRGLFSLIARKCFARPRVSHIHLDEYGSFVWKNIDGKKTIGQLAEILKSEYGSGAEPLYKRLVHYMKVLYNNKLIVWKKK